jgi:hypothetical protein
MHGADRADPLDAACPLPRLSLLSRHLRSSTTLHSAQQLFLSQTNKVYIIDKTERNPINVTGARGTHPAVR